MNYKKASPRQLLQIILEEKCPIVLKFEAAAEYRRRDAKGFRKMWKEQRIVRHRD